MSNYYEIPCALVKHERVVKKSRFIVWLAPVQNRQEAMSLLEQAKKEYPDARHHCWAYVLGDPNNAASAAANDDGEPSGTAGKPILNVIQHKGIGDIMAVVIRYFGGVKLGAGGLVRAYSGATQEATEFLELIQKRPEEVISVICQYHDEPELRRWIDDHSGSLMDAKYDDAASLRFSVESQFIEELDRTLAGWSGSKRIGKQ